jgi:hypothetical protein
MERRLNVSFGGKDFVKKEEGPDFEMNDLIKLKREVIIKVEDVSVSMSSADEKGEFHD